MTFFYCQSGGVWLGEQLYELFVISAAAMLLPGLVRMSWGGEGYKGLGEGEGGRGKGGCEGRPSGIVRSETLYSRSMWKQPRVPQEA